MADVEVRDTVAFADGAGGGNPCPVVLGAGAWSADAMRAAAERFGHETAFVLEPDDPTAADVRLRYFVPRHEMEMCVHATVAATVLLGREGRLPAGRDARVQTPLGVRAVRWDGPRREAVVEQFPPRFGPPVDDPGAVLDALGAPREALDRDAGPVQAVSTARAKLLVPLVDEAALDALVVDAGRLEAVCDALEVTGIYAWTPRARDADVAARQFPLRAGYPEDPATGVAACGLGAWRAHRAGAARAGGWRRLEVAQGRAMGRPSKIVAEALVDARGRVVRTRVGGRMAEA